LQASCNTDGCTAPPPDLTNPAPPESSIVKFVKPDGCDCGFDNSTSITGGGVVDYEIQYQNAGTGDAHNVTVSDPLPNGVTYVSDSCSGGNSCSFNSGSNTVTWNLGTVSPNAATISVDFQATLPNPNADTDIVNTPNVTSDEETTPIPGSPATVHDMVAPPISALTAGVLNNTAGETSFGSSTNASPGDTVVFDVVYANTGTGAAHNVTISTTGLPLTGTGVGSATFPVPGSPSGYQYCPQTLTASTCTLGPAADPGTVAPGTDPLFTTFYVALQINAGACGTVTYNASGQTTEDGPLTAAPVTVNLPACVIP
jgi:uncharacterized repeat protein (TIGR01451 family)